MRFDEFKDYIRENICGYMNKSDDATVLIQDVLKNNGVTKTSVTVREESEVIAPTVYIDEYFKKMEDGEITADEALGMIADTIIEYQVDKEFDAREFLTDEKTKDQIFIKVVNLEANEEKLKDAPYKAVNDLAITYHVAVDMSPGAQGSIMINNGVMKLMGLDEKQLDEIAINNSPKLLPPTLKSMEQVMREMLIGERVQETAEEMDELLSVLTTEEGPNMYVISNTQGLNGAASLFYPEMMEQISEQLGGKDYAIIPSSLHECIIITPDMDNPETEEDLRSMIVEVNTTQVSPEERLSDHPYAYDHDTKEILPMDKYFEDKDKRKEKAAKASERPRKGIENALKEGKEKCALQSASNEVKPKDVSRG